MPGLEALKQRANLYQRFINVQDAGEMVHFARSLSCQEQTLLFEVIVENVSTTLQTQDFGGTYGIVQCENDLCRLLAR